ncbi:M15 family metallopeptidase [Dethiothermospora halolimnae]|uniref:M15 family metallopeptidase n=1 Tax=Dethiothermospora halolimnae TaxID=3114390 RepID=UPI003CCBC168
MINSKMILHISIVMIFFLLTKATPIYKNKVKIDHEIEGILHEKKEVDQEESFRCGPLPKRIIKKVKEVSWKENDKIQLNDLYYVEVLHWGFDYKVHRGELIVHRKVAEEVMEIFKKLYDKKFEIEKIRLISEYNANDNLSMADNNTSAFCYREITGKKGMISKHGYGIAIDINPLINPYVKGDVILPKEGKKYIQRDKKVKGLITKDSIVYKLFKEKGWTWGGEWKTLKDYQHFQKNISIE